MRKLVIAGSLVGFLLLANPGLAQQAGSPPPPPPPPPSGGSNTQSPPPSSGGMMGQPMNQPSGDQGGQQQQQNSNQQQGQQQNNQQFNQGQQQFGQNMGQGMNNQQYQGNMNQGANQQFGQNQNMPGQFGQNQNMQGQGQNNQGMNNQQFGQTGQYDPSKMGQNQQGMMGQQGQTGQYDPSKMGQNQQGMMGQSGQMGQNGQKGMQGDTGFLGSPMTKDQGKFGDSSQGDKMNQTPNQPTFGQKYEQNMQEQPNLEDKYEKQRQLAEEQSLKQMKKGMSGFAKQITGFEKKVAAFQKKGVTPPTELTEAINTAKATMDLVNAAQTFEDVQAVEGDLREAGQTIMEQMQTLERLAQFPQMMKNAQNELKRMSGDFNRAKSKAGRSKIDTSGFVAAYQEKVAGLQTILTEADGSFKAGSGEEAFSKIEGFFDAMQEARDEQQKLEAVSNFATYVGNITRGINQGKSLVKKLAKQKVDVTELNDIMTSAQSKLQELRGLMTSKEVDVDAITSGLAEMEEIRNSFEDKVTELSSGGQKQIPGMVQPQVQSNTLNLDFLGQVKGAMDNVYERYLQDYYKQYARQAYQQYLQSQAR